MKIATILTCYNRKDKTLSCLSSLFHALEKYNLQTEEKIELTIYLTDDGCTDGTSEAVSDAFRQKDIHIQQGDGNLFWAGGMRLSWNEALKCHAEWDYYLLINDDVVFMDNVFDELFAAQDYAKEHYGKEGICSGITCAKDNLQKLTYGGSVWVNRLLAISKRLTPNGQPQLCDLTNANILLVPTAVVDKVGIFYDGYHHGAADYDYSWMARKAKLPVILTAHFCGSCDYDHKDSNAIEQKVMRMNLSQRKAYFEHPLHSNKDYLRYIRRTSPLRLPLVWLGRTLNVYCPKLYYKIGKSRI